MHISYLAQVRNYCHTVIHPTRRRDQINAICIPHNDLEPLYYSQCSKEHQKGKYLFIPPEILSACLQTFLLQKFKLMFRLQGSQHKAHFLINKRNPFTQAPQKYTKVLSFEQFSWNVFTLVFSTIFPGFHMGQILFAFFFPPEAKDSALKGELSLLL